jgi:FkbM family methyltransferase
MPTPLNIQSLCQRYQISAKGIIHIGAHEGQELAQYLNIASEKVLLIEANPQIFLKLESLVADIPNVTALNYAICDREGNINLRLNAYDFSSSILPLKHHLDIYPNMLEVGEITVEARTLDRLLEEQQFISSEFNILVLDIQGAELLAFTGAKTTLGNIDAIYTEVNL